MPQANPEDPTCTTCTDNIEPFKWWVFIGTKEYEKLRDDSPSKNFNSMPIIVGLFNKKNSTIEEQRKKLVEQEANVQAFKTARKIKKSEFYGKNYKTLYKGKLNLGVD